MSLEAKYGGRCASCDERIHVGDQIKFAGDDWALGYIHANCDIASLPNDRDDLSKVCRSCFTIHAGECA